MEITIISFLFFIMIPVSIFIEHGFMKEIKLIVATLSCLIGFVCVQHINFTTRPIKAREVIVAGAENRIP